MVLTEGIRTIGVSTFRTVLQYDIKPQRKEKINLVEVMGPH